MSQVRKPLPVWFRTGVFAAGILTAGLLLPGAVVPAAAASSGQAPGAPSGQAGSKAPEKAPEKAREAPDQVADVGFDCLKAATPLEVLICSDPRLLTLDSKLVKSLSDQAYKQGEPQRSETVAKQRAWMKDLLQRCTVPAKGELSLDVRWRAAPCLEEAYLARLKALGVSPDEEQASIPAAHEPGFIHPNCLLPIVEDEPDAASHADPRVPLDACARGNRHIPVTMGDEGGFAAQSASDGNYTWLSYKPVGRLADGREAVIIWYNSGDNTEYSQIYLLRRTPAPDGHDTLLSGEPLGDGGEGCSGGIDRAELVEGGRKLLVDFRLTPQDLLSEGDEQLANETIDALAFCDVCCTGTVRHIVDLSSKQETTVSATIDELLSEEASDESNGGAGGEADKTQACFDGLVRKAAGGTLPHTFQVPEIKALAASFAKQCLKR